MPIRLLRILLTVALGLALLGTVVGLGFWLFALATGQPLQTTLAVVTDTPGRALPVVDAAGRAVGSMLFDHGRLDVQAGGAGYRILQGIDLAANGGLTIAMLLWLRRLTLSIGAGAPFATPNAGRLRRIGAAMVALSLWRVASDVLAQALLLPRIAPDDPGIVLLSSVSAAVAGKAGVRIDLTIDPALLLTGLGVLALAEAFRAGAALREENEGFL